ncbi:hypothetical protein ID875_29535 [Streptomyces globisporus]|uniref:Uncharacterized protein n=1 Tax=Streptomyces globisporus TaxID=1908 RepID=A0A927GPE3_STRGL|nr:hypothetical protein [Streptomyces globisporus]
MEVVLHLIDGQPKINAIHYRDKHGIFLAPVIPFSRKVNWWCPPADPRTPRRARNTIMCVSS